MRGGPTPGRWSQVLPSWLLFHLRPHAGGWWSLDRAVLGLDPMSSCLPTRSFGVDFRQNHVDRYPVSFPVRS